jgi:hypothetical protein
LCNCAPERIRLQVVRKTSSAVDLDDRDPLPVLRFQFVVAADVDLAQFEAQCSLQLTHLCERTLAQVATLRVKDGDARPTGRCHA